MQPKLPKLPAGIQTFAHIREDGSVYVDKTKYLVDLIDNGKVYFLVRPRRFGKSLTCSTFEALFQGKKELFKGLYAEEFLNRPGFEPSPVIRLDMSRVATGEGLDAMKKSIRFMLGSTAERLGIELKDDLLYSDMLISLIEKIFDKYEKRVVLIIDEYDNPYTTYSNKPDIAEEVRTLLRDFYKQIKVCEQYLKFVFITGITKTAKTGVFSTLNNLADISLDENYGEMCGLTEEEIYKNFTPHLEAFANKEKISFKDLMKKIKDHYDGFCFDGKHFLYNPFSFLLLLWHKDFANYWIGSGTSKFLSDYLKNRNLTIEQFRGMPVCKDTILSPPAEIEVAPPESFLYQAGYLSLRPGTMKDFFTLDYPNTEVLNSMSSLLTQNLLSNQSEPQSHYRNDLLFALREENIEELVDVFNRLLASIPHNDFDGAAKQNIKHRGYKMTAQEWLCRSCLLAFLRGSGVTVFGEVQTNRGRADLVIEFNDRFFVLELKMLPDTAKQALQQIIDNGYAKPYPNAVVLGLAIDGEKRQIVEWEAVTNAT
ncbi:MAG: ATP-binding protein [Fibromonadaceae bacterium]|jgi:hypothetical protein|nr:ATP-binding protein [Fibromonadaceae bacterium]